MAAVHHPPDPPVIHSFASPADLVESLTAFILKAQKDAIDKKGRFTVAISGGSLPKMLRGLIGNPSVKWDHWQVFYADERVVPLDHPDSNHKLCTDELFSKVPIPQSNIHHVDVSLLDDLEELSDAYEKELIKEFAQKDAARFPVFDLILLGMGPDDIRALFSPHELLSEEDRWVALGGFTKAPSKEDHPHVPGCEPRSKSQMGLPASRVKPAYPGHVFWFVDAPAASKLQAPSTEFKL
ncbi:hypothetical protein MPER_07329 [Moniliophthora perniciosa FA553]|nr:hypothetical protein MPER_07329 [Moniliophthora perniciosa FA553]